MRVLALWCPDWPAIAAAADADLPPHHPIAVLHANRVVACSSAARSAGVRRGMRKRQAQATCPEMTVVTADPYRDGQLFEPVVAAVAALIPDTEVLRPGLLVVSMSRAARYFGGEDVVGEMLIDAVSSCGVESQVGVADELFTAVLAARRGQVVEPGGDAAYLADRRIADLDVESSLSDPGREELVDLLRRLGITTIGAFARMPVADVATRFAADAVIAHRLANARPGRPPSGRGMPPDLVVEYVCDPPIERIDAAAFLGRRLADDLHRRLSGSAVACTRLNVEAITERGQRHSRIWRCARPLTPDDTADRIRWQLEGWLTGGRGDSATRPDSPIGMLRLDPVEVIDSGALQYGLTGGGLPEAGLADGDETAERARRSMVRVQGLLGGDAVQVPIRSGGRDPAEQVTMIALGDEPQPRRPPDSPWPDRLPHPTPSVLLDTPIAVLDMGGQPVTVTGRGAFSAEPTTIRWEHGRRRESRELSWWAGPWPTGEQTAMAQMLLEDSRALLVNFTQGRWVIRGAYE